MKAFRLLTLVLLTGIAFGTITTFDAPATQAMPATPADGNATRTLRIDFGGTWIGLPPGAIIRVWQPVPPSDQHQRVRTIGVPQPVEGTVAKESRYGNQIYYFETRVPPSGQLSFRRSYRVQRHEIHGLSKPEDEIRHLSDETRHLYLSPNERVPITGKPLRLIDPTQLPSDPLEMSRTLYNRVDAHVRYDKSQPGYGRGDVLWVCDSRYGNCTDFHSLFIALARSQGIPARFEIGFSLPAKRGSGSISGYHCWGWFHTAAHGWVPVDISEADKHPERKAYYFGNLTENRVAFSVGRDIDLVPRQDGPALNYFVYPYAEIDGQPVPNSKLELDVRFTDQVEKEFDEGGKGTTESLGKSQRSGE